MNNSLKILNAISKHADILELGFPHNTPIADGGQIQGSSHRALKNGIKLKDVFQIVKKFKTNKNFSENSSENLKTLINHTHLNANGIPNYTESVCEDLVVALFAREGNIKWFNYIEAN